MLRDSVLTSLRFLITALGRHSNNVSLVEKFEIIFNSKQEPIAVYAHLALPQWRADNFDIFSALDLVTIHQHWEWFQLCEKG